MRDLRLKEVPDFGIQLSFLLSKAGVMSGSRESRILHYASRRLGRLEAILGKDDMDKVEQEVEEKCRRKWGEETWDAFNRDDTEWRDRELARIYAESDSDDEARNTPETPSPDA